VSKITIQLEVNDSAFHNLMTPELWAQLVNGDWRVLSIGFDLDHGLGSLILRKDDAPMARDNYQGLMKLADGLKQQVRMISQRAKETGEL
jgi:hypothetical protein